MPPDIDDEESTGLLRGAGLVSSGSRVHPSGVDAGRRGVGNESCGTWTKVLLISLFLVSAFLGLFILFPSILSLDGRSKTWTKSFEPKQVEVITRQPTYALQDELPAANDADSKESCPWANSQGGRDLPLFGRINASKYDVQAVRISATGDELCLRVHFVVIEKSALSSYDSPCRNDASIPRFAIVYRPKQVGASNVDEKIAIEAERVGCFSYKEDVRPFHFFVANMGRLRPDAAYAYSIHEIAPSSSSSDQDLFTNSFTYVTPPRQPELGSMHLRLGAARQKTDTTTKYLVVGDMDPNHFESVVKTMLSYNEGDFSFFIHVGDASYASNSGECYGGEGSPKCRWDCLANEACGGRERTNEVQMRKWMTWWDHLQPITSSVPMMTTPGNHDQDLAWFFYFSPPTENIFPGRDDYAADRATGLRDRLLGLPPKQQQAIVNERRNHEMQFYSFNHGRVHFVSLSTEDNSINAYEKKKTHGPVMEDKFKERFETHFGKSSPQYTWLVNDLRSTDRTKHPFIVVYTHRPMYHSSTHHPNCDRGGDWFGCAFRDLYAPLFENNGVSLVISGHSHHYSRSTPIVGGIALTESEKGPRYMVCGTGGFDLSHGFVNPKPSWVAMRSDSHYGFCTLDVSASKLVWKFVAADSGRVLDEVDVPIL